ncbi:MAG TPA: SDR family oxidoreductase [Methylophilaceae bacterium]|nr:SDR family oxidoreductase [Methylophilaceae bacterium]
MPTVLITGANRGIGLEFVRQYAEDGWQVHACSRHLDSAALNQLADQYGQNIRLHQLDVSDRNQIDQLAKQLSDTAIDVLINNAGIYPGGNKEIFGTIDYSAWVNAFEINTMAPLKMAEALVENVNKSHEKKIVNITSKMGSIDDNTSGGYYLYRSSKTALNMVVKSLSLDLAPRGITTIVLHPGWVQTDMGGSNAPTPPDRSVAGMRRVIAGLSQKDSGRFYDFNGQEILW